MLPYKAKGSLWTLLRISRWNYLYTPQPFIFFYIYGSTGVLVREREELEKGIWGWKYVWDLCNCFWMPQAKGSRQLLAATKAVRQIDPCSPHRECSHAFIWVSAEWISHWTSHLHNFQVATKSVVFITAAIENKHNGIHMYIFLQYSLQLHGNLQLSEYNFQLKYYASDPWYKQC
jgi:hypothetical protein